MKARCASLDQDAEAWHSTAAPPDADIAQIAARTTFFDEREATTDDVKA